MADNRILTEEMYAEMVPIIAEIKANGWSESLLHSEYGYATEAVTAAFVRLAKERDDLPPDEFEEETVTLKKSEFDAIAVALDLDTTKGIEATLESVKSAVGVSVKPIKG